MKLKAPAPLVPSRGSNLLRHSAATAMLRGGATLDAIGTVLRHRSPGTTAHYAKVDVAMLGTVAQAWPAEDSRGGEVVDVNHWGRRRLAYPINRHFEGNYVVSQIKLDPAEVPGLEGSLRISEEVIRHMIVKSGE